MSVELNKVNCVSWLGVSLAIKPAPTFPWPCVADTRGNKLNHFLFFFFSIRKKKKKHHLTDVPLLIKHHFNGGFQTRKGAVHDQLRTVCISNSSAWRNGVTAYVPWETLESVSVTRVISKISLQVRHFALPSVSRSLNRHSKALFHPLHILLEVVLLVFKSCFMPNTISR